MSKQDKIRPIIILPYLFIQLKYLFSLINESVSKAAEPVNFLEKSQTARINPHIFNYPNEDKLSQFIFQAIVKCIRVERIALTVIATATDYKDCKASVIRFYV